MKTVDAGVALLDERLPGWHKEIDADNLNLSDCNECVLGQLFGNYVKGLGVLGLYYGDSLKFGFRSGPPSQWWDLSQTWREIVRGRQEP